MARPSSGSTIARPALPLAGADRGDVRWQRPRVTRVVTPRAPPPSLNVAASALALDQALVEVAAGGGTLFDPVVIEVLLADVLSSLPQAARPRQITI